jgi:hypothetical protein
MQENNPMLGELSVSNALISQMQFVVQRWGHEDSNDQQRSDQQPGMNLPKFATGTVS